MIVDAHNHMGGPDKGDGYKQSPDEIVVRMDVAGVDLAVVFPFNEIEPGISFSRANDYIAAGAKKYPDRVIGFCRLDPHFGEKAVWELRRSINELGLRGVKLHPTAQDFNISDPWVVEIAKEAVKLDVPIVFDTGKKQSQPWMVGELAKKVPEAVIIMAHMRGDNYLDVARDKENVYQGTTKAFDQAKLREALKVLGAKKLIAGSDSPYGDMRAELEKFGFASESEKRLILGDNMRGILGL